MENSDDAVLWLSDQEQHIWRSWLSGVAKINNALNEALRSFNLDLNEYEILVNLSEADDHSMRMSELAQHVNQSRSRLTHTITRMQNQGLVRRCRADKDRRGVVAILTDQGMQLLVQAAPTHVRSVRDALVDVVAPEDFKALGRAMKAVLAVAD